MGGKASKQKGRNGAAGGPSKRSAYQGAPQRDARGIPYNHHQQQQQQQQQQQRQQQQQQQQRGAGRRRGGARAQRSAGGGRQPQPQQQQQQQQQQQHQHQQQQQGRLMGGLVPHTDVFAGGFAAAAAPPLVAASGLPPFRDARLGHANFSPEMKREPPVPLQAGVMSPGVRTPRRTKSLSPYSHSRLAAAVPAYGQQQPVLQHQQQQQHHHHHQQQQQHQHYLHAYRQQQQQQQIHAYGAPHAYSMPDHNVSPAYVDPSRLMRQQQQQQLPVNTAGGAAASAAGAVPFDHLQQQLQQLHMGGGHAAQHILSQSAGHRHLHAGSQPNQIGALGPPRGRGGGGGGGGSSSHGSFRAFN
ncbi:hypothetical protein ACSSS7_003597 [Eimeria intestinalis]